MYMIIIIIISTKLSDGCHINTEVVLFYRKQLQHGFSYTRNYVRKQSDNKPGCCDESSFLFTI